MEEARKLTDKKSVWRYTGEAILLVTLVVLSALLVGGKGALQLTLSLAVAFAVPMLIYGRTRGAGNGGMWVLIAASLLMSVGIIINVWQYTVLAGTDVAHPVMKNADAFRYFNFAIYLSGLPSDIHNVGYVGLSVLTMLLWKVLGISIVYPLAMNMMLTLIAIVLSGKITARLLAGKMDGQKAEFLAMLFTAAVCYFLGCATILLKEPMIYVGVALVGYALAGFAKSTTLKWLGWKDIAAFAGGCLLLASVRNTMLYFMAVGIIILTFTSIKLLWRQSAVLLAIAAVIFALGAQFAHFSPDEHVGVIKGDAASEDYLVSNEQSAYSTRLGNYFSYSSVKRALLLPVTCTVQYVVPFPWNFGRDTVYGYSEAYMHVGYPWYAIGGLILFFFIAVWWRKGSGGLNLWALWALACWAITAYLFAGSVSRYVLPFVPLLVPMAVDIVDELENKRRTAAFKYWVAIYVIILAAGLIVCHNISA
jgi:hypothetical protein